MLRRSNRRRLKHNLRSAFGTISARMYCAIRGLIFQRIHLMAKGLTFIAAILKIFEDALRIKQI